tara:strand:+ start:2340 stop:2867 length:528 start_codon:yes stop_codon:yes gene_type:complete
MKNKSTLVFYSLLLSCCFSLLVNAQEQKPHNNFTLNVLQYSDKPNYEKEHVHVLILKNNSSLTSQYSISLFNDQCSDTNQYRLSNKKESNINAEISFDNLNKKSQVSDVVTVQPNKTLKIYLKIKQKISAKLDSWNCTTIRATRLSDNNSKKSKSNIYQSVIIKTFVPNPNTIGH